MNKRPFPTIFCVSLMLLTSCDKQQGQPQVAAPANNVHPVAQDAEDDTGPFDSSTPGKTSGSRVAQDAKDDTGPFLKIQRTLELPFDGATKVKIWNLRGQKVKELTARLLICTDGKVDKHSEIICRWKDTSKPIDGQLVLLVQDGQPFGVDGMRIPSLSLSFQSGGRTTRRSLWAPQRSSRVSRVS